MTPVVRGAQWGALRFFGQIVSKERQPFCLLHPGFGTTAESCGMMDRVQYTGYQSGAVHLEVLYCNRGNLYRLEVGGFNTSHGSVGVD